jgi:hypothetical protein
MLHGWHRVERKKVYTPSSPVVPPLTHRSHSLLTPTRGDYLLSFVCYHLGATYLLLVLASQLQLQSLHVQVPICRTRLLRYITTSEIEPP